MSYFEDVNDLRWDWMRRAVDEAKSSRAESRPDAPPQVGVVIARDGQVLGAAHRGQRNPGDHAEYCLLCELEGKDLTGAEVFTTLEPCTRRGASKIPCAQRLIDAGVGKVWIGLYDPNPSIYREGWRALRDAGIDLGDFPAELRAELRADNHAFLDRFRYTREAAGEQTFDPTANSGTFEVMAEGHRFVTLWSRAGGSSVHAYADHVKSVALARYAQDFDEIDDASAYDFSSRAVTLSQGQIVIFSNGDAFLLIKLLEVHDSTRGAERDELRIEWELRAPVG